MVISPDDIPEEECTSCGDPIIDCICSDIDFCPYCKQPIDYCPGHGEIGDPIGHAFLADYYGDEEVPLGEHPPV